MNNITSSPYIRTSRNFPLEAQPLAVEVNKSYLDIANAINQRVIGLYATGKSNITGESWYINSSQRNQSLRQLYSFNAAGNIPHGINFSQIAGIVKIYGTIFDGTNFYPLPYVDISNVDNQVSVYVDPSNIVITAGAGSPPAIQGGFVILEWLAQV